MQAIADFQLVITIHCLHLHPKMLPLYLLVLNQVTAADLDSNPIRPDVTTTEVCTENLC